MNIFVFYTSNGTVEIKADHIVSALKSFNETHGSTDIIRIEVKE